MDGARYRFIVTIDDPHPQYHTDEIADAIRDALREAQMPGVHVEFLYEAHGVKENARPIPKD